MKNLEINKEIAEFCGWKHCRIAIESMYGFPTVEILVGIPPKCFGETVVPNYVGDLNAMQEAEKLLPEDKWEDFADYILFNGNDNAYSNYTAVKRACLSTAKEHAEAFLHVIGKNKI